MQVIQNVQMISYHSDPPSQPPPLSPISPLKPLVLCNKYVQNFFSPEQDRGLGGGIGDSGGGVVVGLGD